MTGPSWTFAKGHGAGNDFLLLPDPGGELDLSADETVRLCDRRAGLGADGVLRAVRCSAEPEAAAMRAEAAWFMDYRNADGSRGGMCGNGLRVLGRYLVDTGRVPAGRFAVATRAGVREVDVPADPRVPVAVLMGTPILPGLGAGRSGPGRDAKTVRVALGDHDWPAVQVDMGNPHAVAFVPDLAALGDLRSAPRVEPAGAYPHGVTVEFVVSHGAGHLQLRVHERGVGETPACGTGACAAVAAYRAVEGGSGPGRYRVDSPGGSLGVAVRSDGTMELAGSAVIVAHGRFGPVRH
ncbi:diaminopimelate epimerase [Streptomyces sp. PTY087I2]|uniref:diaminopimelate epimerase n=1 Tax=Streptomyces sp. PTY087I2 TaxID=1819298 RepID=UPI00080BF242|nr:diaminopimelate epimerase [Streptomyces sp. PTY087I2]OCC09081.1 Diaminopimelate epimerase [Streptomyces sp. PTY087I2]